MKMEWNKEIEDLYGKITDLTPEAFQLIIKELITAGDGFFKSIKLGEKKRFNIEFVSANPTGPLHLGHGRGGIIGDVLNNILNFIGHSATKEFYVNDAGAQIQKLALSFKVRCQQTVGKDVSMPENGYQGDYLIDLAKVAIAEHSASFADKSREELGKYAKEKLLKKIEITLQQYGISFDVWFSEKSLHTSGAVEKTLSKLQDDGHLYEKDGALWFKSTSFGDDKDRVIKKASGEYTYVASDIAYMEDKVHRGFDELIMLLGHDHHGYGDRLEGLRQALGIQVPLKIVFFQLVKMKASGKMVRMSKRAGNIVTLEGVIEEVGTDVARFFYLNRKADAQLEFDLDLALKKTDENPVYYIQYAYVRTGSILQKSTEENLLKSLSADDVTHIGQEEHALLKKMVYLKELLATISTNYQTHQLTYYVLELAQEFHRYYGKNKVINLNNIKKSRARLVLIKQLRATFRLCLNLLGISKPEKM